MYVQYRRQNGRSRGITAGVEKPVVFKIRNLFFWFLWFFVFLGLSLESQK